VLGGLGIRRIPGSGKLLGGPVFQGTVRSLGVVVFTPQFNHVLGLPQAAPPLGIQTFIAEPAVEGFTFPVLLGAAWVNEQRQCSLRF